MFVHAYNQNIDTQDIIFIHFSIVTDVNLYFMFVNVCEIDLHNVILGR